MIHCVWLVYKHLLFAFTDHHRYTYEQDRLFKKMEDLLKNFDAELRCLRHNKFKLDIDLKNADLR